MRRRDVLALPLAAAPMTARRTRAQAALPVVASFSILADMARQIGGGRVAVRALVGPDADAHGFQPRPSDVEALRGARLVVRNGLGFEPWLDRLLRAAGHGGPVATGTEGIEPRAARGHDHDHGGGGTGRRGHGATPRRVAADPHAWQDLRLGQAYARNIGEGLAAADPDGAEDHRRGAEIYAARLAALDAWVRARIGTVPAARRKVVTGHDAFAYFGAAYGVAFLAPQATRNEAGPSAAAVASLVRQVRAEGITAVFVENLSNQAAVRRLAAEAGVRVRGRLHSDALSRPDGPAPTYEAMFRHNVGLLVPAMRGEEA